LQNFLLFPLTMNLNFSCQVLSIINFLHNCRTTCHPSLC
jgi:hypothetical protein